MSETHRTLFNKRICSLLIAGAFVLLVTVFALQTPIPPPEAMTETSETEPLHRRRVRLTMPPVFNSEAFYRTIIDNNLFRPLGWTPSRPREPYRLIGTILPIDANTPPRAILQTTAGKKTYIVTTGETLDASTEVVEIAGKQVILSRNGQQRTLRLNTAVYLNTYPTRRTSEVSVRPQPDRPPPVRQTPAPTPMPDRRPPRSQWQTREGEPIRFGDARLKNPEKWGLRRR